MNSLTTNANGATVVAAKARASKATSAGASEPDAPPPRQREEDGSDAAASVCEELAAGCATAIADVCWVAANNVVIVS